MIYEKRSTAGTGPAAPTVSTTAKGAQTITGYAALFNSVYSMGWFTEEIAGTAFDNTDMTDVRALFNHNSDLLLGRTTAGTMTLSVDRIGLKYSISLPDSPNGQNMAEAIRRGDCTQSSWGFSIVKDSGDLWTRQGGQDHRIITAVRIVYDVSPVTFPANASTTATIAKPIPGPGRSRSIELDISIRENELALALLKMKAAAIPKPRPSGIRYDIPQMDKRIREREAIANAYHNKLLGL